MLFNSWQALLKILVVTPLAYAWLLLALRWSGKRTLTQLNMFDFVITVAFGSTLATTILNTTVALLDGVLALALLIGLQLMVAWISVRLPWFSRLVKSRPRLLYYQGTFRHDAMRQERVRQDELLQAVRRDGLRSLEQVHAIIMETNGNLSVIKESSSADDTALDNVPDTADHARRAA
jgi:uncharacterized membrane protein YcaP (DUF421 family)